MEKGGKPAPCVNVFMVVDLWGLVFIPWQANFFQKILFYLYLLRRE
jgi:hypothetical protein